MVPLPPARPTPTNAPAPGQGSTRARRRAPTSRRWTAATSRTRTGAAMRLGPRWWRAVAGEDPHGCGDESTTWPLAPPPSRGPAQAQRRDSGSDNARPIYVITTPAATTRTPSTFGPARIRPTGPGLGRGGSGLRNSSSAQRDPGAGAGMGRARLAQCEPSATQSTPPRAVRAQRDEIRPSSIRASPPRTMRPEVTSPNRLPPGAGQRRRLPLGAGTAPPPRVLPRHHAKGLTTTPASIRPRLGP